MMRKLRGTLKSSFVSLELLLARLESANSSILVASRFFKRLWGKIRILCKLGSLMPKEGTAEGTMETHGSCCRDPWRGPQRPVEGTAETYRRGHRDLQTPTETGL